MNETLSLLFSRLKIDPVLYRHSRRNSNDAHKKLRFHYRANSSAVSKEISHTVHDIYKNDINDFGYSLGF